MDAAPGSRSNSGEISARAAAHEITAKVKAKAAKDTETRLAKADAVLAQKLAAAETSLEAARRDALASLEAVAAEAAQDIVSKVSGGTVTAAKAQSAVRAVFANA